MLQNVICAGATGERKADGNNYFIERTYILEKKMDIQEEQIKVANHRIKDLGDVRIGHQ